jgi:tRNA (cytidine/uridine-2'-O-)-methyltransferase
VVLVDPEIPWNTGNVGRSCLGFGAELHLVGRLGFSLDERSLRRSGLDYWPRVGAKVFPDRAAYFRGLKPGPGLFLFSRSARRPLWPERIPAGATLVFGSESAGLPAALKRRFARRLFRIPLSGPIRSLNLSTAVGVVLAEASRQGGLRRYGGGPGRRGDRMTG